MINQDQLTKYERVRLEAFAMSINSTYTIQKPDGVRVNLNDLFEQAKQIEAFLKAANPN